MGSVVIPIDREDSLNGDARYAGWDEDNGLLFVDIGVIRRGFAHDNIDFAAGVTGTTRPPFLMFCEQLPDILKAVVGLTAPLRTYSLPSFFMVRVIFVASLEATSGSVMRKADLILPSNKGASQSLF